MSSGNRTRRLGDFRADFRSGGGYNVRHAMNEDAALLRRYLDEKSQAAFTEFVHRNIALVYGAALRRVRGNSHLAQDVTQTVFTSAARKAALLTQRPVIAGWLFQATQFTDLENTLRRAGPRQWAPVSSNRSFGTDPSRVGVRVRLDTPSHAWSSMLNAIMRPDPEALTDVFCLDSAAQSRSEQFFAQLPAETRAELGTARRMLAEVFGRWRWQGDFPMTVRHLKQMPAGNDAIFVAAIRYKSGRRD